MILSPVISDSKECLGNSARINSESKKQLVARWQTKEGKLICQWIRTSI